MVKKISLRTIKQRNVALKLHKYFCLIWKSNDISFNEAVKQLKLNFKVVDNVISNKNVKSFIKYECKPKKVKNSNN